MKKLKQVLIIITVLAVVSTYLCRRFEITAIAEDYAGSLVYVMLVLFMTILMSLDNVQEHLENPFDQIGEDDIAINAEKFVERLGLK